MLSVLNAVMATMVFAPTAAAQEAVPTDEEIAALIEAQIEEAAAIPGDAPSFYAKFPAIKVGVTEAIGSDLDGDGIEDLIFPIPADALGPSRVTVSSGFTGEFHFTIEAPDGEPSFASASIGVPDLDGDGVDDLVVTAPANEALAPLAGRVYVYSGVDGALLWTITGARPGGLFGLRVATAGDVNGDGLHDLIVGEPSPETGLPGRAFIFHGRQRAVAPLALTATDADQSFTGWFADDQFGRAVATAGDADGDGLDDVIVGAPASNLGDPANLPRAGEAHLYRGVDGQLLATIEADGPRRQLGTAVATAGDWDGDGRAEIVVSAPGEMAGDANNEIVPAASEAIVYSSTWWAQGPASLTSADAHTTLAPQGVGAVTFGVSIEFGRDVDGDGIRDLLVTGASAEEILNLDEPQLNPDERAFRLVSTTHVYAGGDGAPLYHFVTGQGSGHIIEIEYPGPTVAPDEVGLIGDVDRNLAVEGRDATLVMADIGTVDETGDLTTDVNGDGVVDAWDAVNVLMYVDQATALAIAESMLTPEDCLDANGVVLPTCECLLLADTIVNPDDLDCDDGSGDDGGGEPGPPPPPPNNCDDLPRETEADCQFYAECVAGNEFGPEFDAIDAAIADLEAQVDAAEDALDAELDAALAPLIAAGLAAANAQAAAQESLRAQAEADARTALNWFYLQVGLSVGGGGATAYFGKSNPIGVMVAGVGILYFELEASKKMQDIVNQYRLESSNVEAAANGLVAPAPNGLTAALWNAVVTAGAALNAAAVAYDSAAAAAYATYESTVTPLNEQIEQQRNGRDALALLQFLREEEVRTQCVTELNELPQ